MKSGTLRIDLVDFFLKQIERLRLAIVDEAEGYRFFSSSLLLVYDAAVEPQAEPILRVIDFAKTYSDHDGVDNGFIKGLDNIVNVLKKFLNSKEAECL